MIKSKLLAKYSKILHYFGDKMDSSNMEKLGIKLDNLISAQQIHGNKVVIVKNNKNNLLRGSDGMITNNKLNLCIRTADCMPIFLYDPGNKIIAALHAGWKSLYKGIIENSILKMCKLGSNPQNIIAAIGPHIHSCCYNIPEERIKLFKKYKDSISGNYLSLGEIAVQQMDSLRLKKNNIEISPVCTSCDSKFWSFRRDKQNTQRMVNFISLV